MSTPTRTLVDTSVGVREAARNLQKLSLHWESPNKAVIVVKPDRNLIEKTQLVVECLWRYGTTVYVEDTVYPHLSIPQNGSEGSRMLVWNASELRSIIGSTTHAGTNLPPLVPSDSKEPELDGIYSSSDHMQNGRIIAENVARDATNGHSAVETVAFDPEEIDIVITLGGDGTVLHASWLFQTVVPPILPFHLGSLGFLTVFNFTGYKVMIDRVFGRDRRDESWRRSQQSIVVGSSPDKKAVVTVENGSRANGKKAQIPAPDSGIRITLRMRFTCAVYRAKTIMSLKCANQACATLEFAENGMIPETIPDPDDVYQILNDLVVYRGPSAFMSSLEVFGDGKHLTTVQADGLVVSTPTGSTAYSLSAGGSMVHPDVPAILLTPICPHTLSFRPMLLPDSMELKIVIPHDSRTAAWASFDGRHRLELQKGDAIVVTASAYPVPTLCRKDQTHDWFDSLGRCLRWNERARQKSFVWGQGVVVEEDGDDESGSARRLRRYHSGV